MSLDRVLIVNGILSFSLISCSSYDIPQCADKETISLVKEIAKGEMAKTAAASFGLVSYPENTPLELKFIKMDSKNSETGEFSCSATLKIGTGSNMLDQELPITYTSGAGQNEDGEVQHLVTVYGL